MFRKIRIIFAIVVIILMTVSVTILVCLKIAETFFFDKFFYQKSSYFGYNQNLKYSSRTKDMYHFGLITAEKFSFPQKDISNKKVFGSQDKNVYTIVLLGDSFVWGQGITSRDRLSEVLQSKLARYHPTKVYSLGLPQDAVLDHLAKLDALVSQGQRIDLYIVPMVMNDALLPYGDGNRYHSPEAQTILDRCRNEHPTTRLRTYPDWSAERTPEEAQRIVDQLDKDTGESWTDELSVCIAQASIQRMQELSQGKLIFLVTDDYSPEQHNFNPYTKMVEAAGGVIVRSRDAIFLPEYERYFSDPTHYFTVSPKEAHPSALAYKMYADVLVQRLLSRSRKF